MVGFLSKSFHAATGVNGLEGKFEVLLQGRYTGVVTGLIKIDTGRVYVEYTWKSKNSYGLAAAIPTPRSNAPLKLSAACPPAGCSLQTWQVPGLGRAPQRH